MTDWRSIREEYITGELPMRALAEKHGVNYSSLRTQASRGAWSEKRREFRNMKDAQTILQHVACSVPPLETCNMSQNVSDCPKAPLDPEMEEVFNVARLMLTNIGNMMRRGVQAYEMRALSDSLQDVREILQSRPVMDAEEQRARIDRLQAEIREHEKDPKDNRLEVVFRDGAEKYGV